MYNHSIKAKISIKILSNDMLGVRSSVHRFHRFHYFHPCNRCAELPLRCAYYAGVKRRWWISNAMLVVCKVRRSACTSLTRSHRSENSCSFAGGVDVQRNAAVSTTFFMRLHLSSSKDFTEMQHHKN